MTAERPKGIVDPWKRVDPLRSPPRPEPTGRRNLDDIDLDADLVVPGQYLIRTVHASISVTHVRVAEPADALEVLADCLVDLWRVAGIARALVEIGVGVRSRTAMHNVPDETTPASLLHGRGSAIWFEGSDLDRGMLALVRVLRRSNAADILRKWGIVPMTK